jgi:anaerobic selenocysteine-containing dehydrogenase
MADYHLAVRPGTDAWCLAALAAILVQDGLLARDWLAEHTTGFDSIEPALKAVPVADYARICGVDEALLRRVAERIGRARSVSMIEDLGVQMNRHSTLVSWLQRLVWLLTGHFARQGTNNAFVPLLGLSALSNDKSADKIAGSSAAMGSAPRPYSRSPVTQSRIIMGLVPCNVIPEEILTDHPKRFRAMLIESANPAHSLADTRRMREAIRALELSVVVDVAMTETAQLADYVLPATSQFEKAEATFFTLEFPRNSFHLRRPLFAPRPGTLTEAEIHARLLEAMGELSERDYRFLRGAARFGLTAFALAFAWASRRDSHIARYAAVALYRTLGTQLPPALATAASLWGICQMYVRRHPDAARRAGFAGSPLRAGNALFRAIVDSPSGVIFAVSEYEDSWKAVQRPGHRIELHIPELLAELQSLAGEAAARSPDFPFVLSAGERRSDTSNTAVRDTAWHRKGSYGTLRIHPSDAASLGCAQGDWVRVTSARGSAEAPVEITDELQPGHVSLPNGQGIDYRRADGTVERRGVAVNELTDANDRDPFAGTPWHKHVPVRIERLQEQRVTA